MKNTNRIKKGIAVLALAGMVCGLGACGEKETIKIASKPMTEQYILTEMLAQLIEDGTDYEVEITKGVGGGTTNIHPALLKGEFDLYPEYTRSAWLNVAEPKATISEVVHLKTLQEVHSM